MSCIRENGWWKLYIRECSPSTAPLQVRTSDKRNDVRQERQERAREMKLRSSGVRHADEQRTEEIASQIGGIESSEFARGNWTLSIIQQCTVLTLYWSTHMGAPVLSQQCGAMIICGTSERIWAAEMWNTTIERKKWKGDGRKLGS